VNKNIQKHTKIVFSVLFIGWYTHRCIAGNPLALLPGLTKAVKLWSSGRALGSRSEGRGFDSNARWKWCQSHAMIDSNTQFWFIIEN